MGESARRTALRRMNASERLDAGLDLSNRMIQARIQSTIVPKSATPKERVRTLYRALRRAGS